LFGPQNQIDPQTHLSRKPNHAEKKTIRRATQGYCHKAIGGASGNAEITGYRGDNRDLRVPSELGGYPVTSIGVRAFRNKSRLSSVTLPEGLKSIGHFAFAHGYYFSFNWFFSFYILYTDKTTR